MPKSEASRSRKLAAIEEDENQSNDIPESDMDDDENEAAPTGNLYDNSSWPPECHVALTSSGVNLRQQPKALEQVIKTSFKVARMTIILENAWPDVQSAAFIRLVMGTAAAEEGKAAKFIKKRIEADLPFARTIFKPVCMFYFLTKFRLLNAPLRRRIASPTSAPASRRSPSTLSRLPLGL